MAKRYIYLKATDLQRVAATLDRAFPYRPAVPWWQSLLSVVAGYPRVLWFDIVRAALAIVLLGIAIWRAL